MTSKSAETFIRQTVIARDVRRVVSDFTVDRANVKITHNMFQQHEDEKHNLQNLNKKFGRYIERVKILEANNQRLKIQLDHVKQQCHTEWEKIKGPYEHNLTLVRKELDKTAYNKESVELRGQKAKYEGSLLHQQTNFVNGFVILNRNRLVMLEQQSKDSASEPDALRYRVEDNRREIERLENEAKQQIDHLQLLRDELDRASLARHITEIERQSLEEKLHFIKAVHEEQRNELIILATIPIDVGQFYRNELTGAIIKIRQDYENLARAQQRQWEEYYENKTEELRRQAAETKRKAEETSRSGQAEIMDKEMLISALDENRTNYEKLRKQSFDSVSHLRQLENELERIRSHRNRSEIDGKRQLIALRAKWNMLKEQIREVHESNVSLEFEVCVYKRLLETDEENLTPSYLIKISKKSFKLIKLKDLTKGIFIDISGSTQTRLHSTGKTVLQAEQSIYQNISFDHIVIWDDTAQLCTKHQVIEPTGGTSPQSIFQNPSTKKAFQSSDVIVFVTDGEIDQESVTEFAKQTKDNLNKVLIVCIIVDNKLARPSQVNVSVVAPLMVDSNILCLFYDGQTFYVLAAKGYITKFYKSPTSLTDYKSLTTLDINELFHDVIMYEHADIPDGFIPIRDDEQEIVALHFNQFIGLTKLQAVIQMDDGEWKAVIQYGKINNRLDQLRKFVVRMKNAATPINLKTVEDKIESKYFKQQNDLKSKIASLESSNVQGNKERLTTLQRQLQDILDQSKAEKREGIKHFNATRHRTREYWNNVENMIYSQTIGSYTIDDFTLSSRRPQ